MAQDTEYGILGAGQIGQAIARHLTRAGHRVVVANRRGPDSLADLVVALGARARAGTTADAAAAPVVFLTLTWSVLPGVLPGLAAWGGRIVVDATNPFVAENGEFRLLDLGERTSSEVVSAMLPGARLVKAFNTLPAAVLAADPKRRAGGGWCSSPATTRRPATRWPHWPGRWASPSSICAASPSAAGCRAPPARWPAPTSSSWGDRRAVRRPGPRAPRPRRPPATAATRRPRRTRSSPAPPSATTR